VQVVEALNQDWRRVQTQRKTYTDALNDALHDALHLLRGQTVTLTDQGSPPLLPSVRTPAGQKALSYLVQELRNEFHQIATLSPGRVRTRTWTISGVSINALFEHASNSPASTRGRITWSGGYRVLPQNVCNPLADAIRHKVAKRYSKPSHRYWLLVYSNDIPLMASDPAIADAHQLAQQESHPFDKIRYLLPYHDQDLGHLLEVWPQSPTQLGV
jgi:hypothetical protein